MGLANSLVLPAAEGGVRESARGMEVSERSRSIVGRTLRLFGSLPAKKLHQYPGPKAA
jgi:hypothetical protein